MSSLSRIAWKTTGSVRCAELRHEGGFTLVEMVIVILVLMVGAALTFINLGPALRATKVDNAYRTAASAMDLARGRATSMRLVYQVQFLAPRTITVTEFATGVVVLNESLPNDISFDAEPGIPSTNATAPDRFGSGSATGAIDFDATVGVGGANTVFFYPDGSARDGVGNYNSGVVYIARPGELMSSRAITLYGLSGRIRGWRLSQSGAKIYWRQI